jgi:glycosidase
MPTSLYEPEVVETLVDARRAAQQARMVEVTVDGRRKLIPRPFPTPADWRDAWIYFVLLDRFNNPRNRPAHPPYDGPELRLQGGTLDGMRQQLSYLQALGVGALWLSPVLKNAPQRDQYYGGYAIQDFLTIEPRFTSDPARAARDPSLGQRELKALVDEAHARGMYVILDIVLNHAGNVFNYEGARDAAPWHGWPAPEYKVYWRDETGNASGTWTDIGQVRQQRTVSADAAVWPLELQRNDFFRRRGADGPNGLGDFWIFKELVTEYRTPEGRYPVRNLLIRAYQYLIAEYDVDGFRIDTLMYIEREFARVFGNAMREFALSIGKANFFTFGEVWREDDQADARIAEFVGRTSADGDDLIGVDAALDFPVFRRLRDVCKGWCAPTELAAYYEYRKQVQRGNVSSHGDSSRYFVTFLDNHDLNDRFYYRDPANPHRYDAQHTLALTCLYTLQGIPCLYYGTEQGLCGSGPTREHVREALWGKQQAFDTSALFFVWVKRLSELRKQQPALRYGRQYFREVSGDGQNFGISPYPGGVLAYARILNDEEVLVVANPNTTDAQTVHVVVDSALHPAGTALDLLLTNRTPATPPGRVLDTGGQRAVRVTLQPMEVQVIGKSR